jgi:ribosomal protein L11 methyltransferase
MTWQVTLPCTRAEGERIERLGEDAAQAEAPVLVATEEAAEQWRLDAYFERRPGKKALDALLALVPSAGRMRLRPRLVAEQDWVTLSQQGLEPIRAGRFFVHTPAHRGAAPPGMVRLEIDAGRAFGTGHHETTTGCLQALDMLKRQGFVARDLIDVGTGSGLLAFAALRLWPIARATASDIDRVSIQVTVENAAVNGARLGTGPGRLALAVAPGLNDPMLVRRAPYDLVIANILAGPLIELAPALAGALLPGGRIVLAGLLASQAERVTAAYRREGLRPLLSVVRGEWPTLVLRRPRR